MRKFKRLASIALAAVMTLAMCAPAFAEGTSNQEESKVTYNVYQIFKGTYASDIDGKEALGEIEWGANAKNSNGEISGALDALKSVNEATDARTKLNIITQYVDMTGTPYKTIENQEPYRQVTVDVEDDGYYLVKTAEMGSDDVATTYLVNVTGKSLVINPKTSKPMVEKKVNNSSVNTAAVGNELKFVITGTLPSNFADFETYYYQFKDTMDKGLEFKQETVEIMTENDDDITGLFVVDSVKDETTKNTTITITSTNLKDSSAGVSLTSGTKITVTYKATITGEANMGTDPTTNKVILRYSNDPSKSGNGTTPDSDDHPVGETVEGKAAVTKTYMTGLTVKDFAGGTPMTGAEFELTGSGLNAVLVVGDKFEESSEGSWYKLKNGLYTTEEPNESTSNQYESTEQKYIRKTDVTVSNNSTENKVSAVIDKDGFLTIKGMNVGTYTLTQTKALPGYNKYGAITFTISFDENGELFTVDAPAQQDKPVGETNGVYEGDGTEKDKDWFYLDIEQGRGSLLPETGGVGTTMMYIGGMLLIAVAGATFILKGKKAEDAE